MEKSQNYKTEISNHDMVIRGDFKNKTKNLRNSFKLLQKPDERSPRDSCKLLRKPDRRGTRDPFRLL